MNCTRLLNKLGPSEKQNINKRILLRYNMITDVNWKEGIPCQLQKSLPKEVLGYGAVGSVDGWC